MSEHPNNHSPKATPALLTVPQIPPHLVQRMPLIPAQTPIDPYNPRIEGHGLHSRECPLFPDAVCLCDCLLVFFYLLVCGF